MLTHHFFTTTAFIFRVYFQSKATTICQCAMSKDECSKDERQPDAKVSDSFINDTSYTWFLSSFKNKKGSRKTTSKSSERDGESADQPGLLFGSLARSRELLTEMN